MRIIVWGINYTPEPTGIAPFNTGLCEWLDARGHEVEMVTGFPYYPAWRKWPTDCGQLYRTDRMAGVRVRRCWQYVPGRVTPARRILHEASFLLTSTLRLLTLRRPDVLVVVSPPLAAGVPAWLVSRLWRRPYVFHVQDLQPDAAVGLGMLRPGAFTRVLYALEARAYRQARLVSGISDGMLEAFRRKGVPETRVVFFPNWVGDHLAGAPDAGAAARAAFCPRLGLNPDDFLLCYSGNIGMKQGLGVLIDAAGQPDAGAGERRLQWIVAGDGAGRAALEQQAAAQAGGRVRFLPLQAEAAFQEMLAAADVSVITQQKGTGQFFFPSKLLTALARAKPVLAVADADSELARAVREGDFGLVAPPDDPVVVAASARAMARAGADQLARWGENGREWVGRYRRSAVLGEFERRLAGIAKSDGGRS